MEFRTDDADPLLALEEGPPHDEVVREVFHGAAVHDGVVEVDLGHEAGGELALELD